MKTVQVTGGEVVLREREDLRVRDRQYLQEQVADATPILRNLPFDEHGNLDQAKAMADGLLDRESLHAMLELTKAMLIVRIASWTLPGDPPRTVEEVGDLNAVLYDELSVHVSDGLQDLLGEVDFEPSNPHAPGFSETPTPPSAV